MSDFVDRIDEKLKEKNLKRAALCDELGLSSTSLTDWKRRGTIPAGDVCLKIADFLQVSFSWLVAGEEDSTVILSDDKKELLKMWGEVSEHDKEELLVLLRYQSERQKKAAPTAGAAESKKV